EYCFTAKAPATSAQSGLSHKSDLLAAVYATAATGRSVGLVIGCRTWAVDLVGIHLAPVAPPDVVRGLQDEMGLVIGAAHLRLNVVVFIADGGFLRSENPGLGEHDGIFHGGGAGDDVALAAPALDHV